MHRDDRRDSGTEPSCTEETKTRREEDGDLVDENVIWQVREGDPRFYQNAMKVTWIDFTENLNGPTEKGYQRYKTALKRGDPYIHDAGVVYPWPPGSKRRSYYRIDFGDMTQTREQDMPRDLRRVVMPAA